MSWEEPGRKRSHEMGRDEDRACRTLISSLKSIRMAGRGDKSCWDACWTHSIPFPEGCFLAESENCRSHSLLTGSFRAQGPGLCQQGTTLVGVSPGILQPR